MAAAADRQKLLSTKLHRPRVATDLVHRERLKQLLDAGLDRPLILVAAPAGFGKSTLLSHWLQISNLPNAWISLDESDSDLSVFLTYFLAAVESIFPNALPETRSFLAGVSLPETGVVARSLINELDWLEHDFILVLDDYHVIHGQAVHELISLLLQHPPGAMHLVLGARMEPPLSLGVLRARNHLVEIRGQDMRFSRAEIAAFVQQAVGVALSDDMLDVLANRTEGWAAGLRLATLTTRQGDDVGAQLASLHGHNRYVFDYLMSEVLAQVPPAMRRFLLKTAILDQVCPSLGQAVMGAEDPDCDPKECLAWLERANMFTVAIGAHDDWYRYHHLFREFLRDQLVREASAAGIAALHTQASAWYARQGSLEEALRHALLGGDTPGAVRLLAGRRQALMDSEQWQSHERVFHIFPADAIMQHPELMLMAAEIDAVKRTNWAQFPELLDQAASLVEQMPDQPEQGVYLRGEIDALRSLYAFETNADPEGAIVCARRALAATPRAWYYVRSLAWVYLAAGLQATGQLEQAYAALAGGDPEDTAPSGVVYARVAGSRCFVEWMAGDLPAVAQGAAHLKAVSETHHRHESLGWAHYLLSCVAYERNDLPVAEAHAQALEELRYLSRPLAYLQSAFVHALIHQARGKPDQARQALDLALAFLRETRSEGLVPLAQAFEAELAVRQGNPGGARHWATTVGPFLPLGMMPYFYAPQLTLPRVLLALNTPASRAQAGAVLSRLHAFVTSTHNNRFIIEVLALQALLQDAQGEEQAALATLRQAVTLAEPGGFVRLFVDLGPRLAKLLIRLQQAHMAAGYVNQLLQAFAASPPAASQPGPGASTMQSMELVEPLTDRELEVLALLARRMSSKEIAQALIISPLTVKRHTSNIYSKLQVGGRREAVAKAALLGLL